QVDEPGEQRAEVADRRLRPCGTQRGNEKQRAGDDQAVATAEVVRDNTADAATDDTTEQRAGDGPAFGADARALLQAERRDEILLDRFGRTGDHRGVVSKQQAAERGDDG